MRKLSLVLIVMVTAIVLACKRTEPPKVSTSEPAAALPAITAKTFVTAFPAAATSAGMTAAEADRVVDVWKRAGPRMDELTGEISGADFDQALAIFVKTKQAGRNIHAGPINSGEAYWLAFCVSESLSRSPMDEANRKKIVEERNALGDVCIKKIRKGLLAQVPTVKRIPFGKIIEEKLSEAKSGVRKGIDELSANVLYPGLKGEMADADRTRVLKRYEEQKYPEYGDTMNSATATPDEVYVRRLDGFFKGFVANLLFELTVPEFEWHLDKTLLWGDMQWGGVGSGSEQWPLWIEMTPRAHSTSTGVSE